MLAQQLTLKEAGKILGVGYARMATLARENILPVVRLGRQLRIDPRQLEEFIAGGGKALPGGWRRKPEGSHRPEAAQA
jgi:excisionase family DNA binding protein